MVPVRLTQCRTWSTEFILDGLALPHLVVQERLEAVGQNAYGATGGAVVRAKFE